MICKNQPSRMGLLVRSEELGLVGFQTSSLISVWIKPDASDISGLDYRDDPDVCPNHYKNLPLGMRTFTDSLGFIKL